MLAQAQPAHVAVSPSQPRLGQIGNEFFRVSFDLNVGGFTVWRNHEKPLWQNAVALIVTTQGQRSSVETAYARSVQVLKFSDKTGVGQQLIVQCIDRQHELDLEIRLYIFDQREAIAVEIIGKNVSKEDFTISRIELFWSLTKGHRCPKMLLK